MGLGWDNTTSGLYLTAITDNYTVHCNMSQFNICIPATMLRVYDAGLKNNIWFPPHLESFDRSLRECVTSAPQVFQIWREAGFLTCWPPPRHCYTNFTLRGGDTYVLWPTDWRKNTSIILTGTQSNAGRYINAQRHVPSERRVIVLTAVVAAEILVLAEVVALSFIA